MTPYQALANAIVELAVKDYKKAFLQHSNFPDNEDYANEVKSIENFFNSDWFVALTDLDSEYLLTGARRMARKEAKV